MKKEKKLAYKVTDSNMRCLDFQFELKKKYKIKGKLILCENGFHYCDILNDCFSYYSFDPKNRVFLVEILGEVLTEGDKSCTAELKFVKELTWTEVLTLVNTGTNNTGRMNSGYWNSGNRNSGNRNSGDWNSGDWNSGYLNSGYWNSGNRNSGDWNSGYWNSGNRNSGNSNSGNRNSGNSNSGNRNSGYWNSGDWNSGYSNSGDWNSGAFCTGEETIKLFNKDSDWTHQQFIDSKVFDLLCEVYPNIWVDESLMTYKEKEENPSYKTTGGYLKAISYKEAFKDRWDNWSYSNRNEFKSLPNFDSEIFEEITGVKI